jgi:hypothetical protein
MGMLPYDTIIYNDNDADQIESLPPTAFHRNVDLEIVNADKEGWSTTWFTTQRSYLTRTLPGYVKTYIVLPSTIYGVASGKLVDLGIQHSHSQQLPGLIKIGLSRGQAGMVGEGKNIWPHVHIDEGKHSSQSKCTPLLKYQFCVVTDLYIILFDSIMSNSATGHGRDGYYIAENGEYTFYEAAKAVGEALVAKGLGKASEPTSFTEEELGKQPLVKRLQSIDACN